MKKALLVIASAALLFAGCTKDQFMETVNRKNTDRVVLTAVLDEQGVATKASWDKDGAGVNVNHWVVEVRDAVNTGIIYYHGEETGPLGRLTHSFELFLVKGHTYYIAFWADNSGCYKTGDLTKVECTDITKIGNDDKYDGFFRCIEYVTKGDATENVPVLYRPFAQVNIVTTDLPDLKSTTTPGAYLMYEPVNYSFKVKVPTVFSAFTGETSSEKEITIKPVESKDRCYASYADAKEKTTIFMVYLLAGKNTMNPAPGHTDVHSIDFSFNSGTIALNYNFTNIPLKRNYRTNISGRLLSNDTKWNVEVDPRWFGERNVNYTN